MLKSNDLKNLISQLSKINDATVTIGGFAINLRVSKDLGSVTLTTPVYYGGNFIPLSVRACLKERPPFDTFGIKSVFEVDEDNYIIILRHFEPIIGITENRFVSVLEEFSYTASLWRDYFEEHDRNDLVRVPTG